MIKAVRSGDARKRLSDGDGLYLLLFVKGGAHGWRLDYSFQGRRKTLSLGTYPSTTLAIARRKADAAREKVADSLDPSQERKAERVGHAKAREAEERQQQGLPPVDSFEAVAREWFEVKRGGWAKGYADKIIARLTADVFPYVGKEPVGGVTPVQLLDVLRRVEARGVIETAHRTLENCGQIFRYAVATGRSVTNPARDLKDALRRPEPKHFPAITDPKRFGELLRACDAYAATPVVRAALKLAPMLLLRPGELRYAEWHEISLDTALWTVPSARMKRELREKQHGAPHLVPLPKQAVTVLRDLHKLTGHATMVFRGERHHHRAMSENTINAALRAMGFSAEEVTGHGFRATARTMLHERAGPPQTRIPQCAARRYSSERLGFSPDVIEAQLAHSVRDSLGRAYNRTEFVEQRRAMLQAWADFLDQLRLGVVAVSQEPSGASKATRRASSPRKAKVKLPTAEMVRYGAQRRPATVSHLKTATSE
jgi:integrase